MRPRGDETGSGADSGPAPRARPPGRGFTLIELLVVIFLIIAVAALLLPALSGGREAARRIECVNNLRQISLATQDYLQLFGAFPASSGWPNLNPYLTKQYSLFTRILPGLERTSLFSAINFDVGLDDFTLVPATVSATRGHEANATVMAVAIREFICPSDPIGSLGGTNYRANDGVRAQSLPDERFDGPFGWHQPTSAAAVRDGLSHKAAFSEKVRGTIGRGWLDLRADMLTGPNYQPNNFDRTMATCAFQDRRSIAYATSMGTNWMVGALSQTLYNHYAGPESPEPDCQSPGHSPIQARASARSNHRSGVNLATADGAVRFVAASIHLRAWQALATRAGGEVDDSF